MSLLLESCRDVDILMEAYYGKPKEFLEIEKRLAKIIDMIKLMMEDPSEAVDINRMKEIAEIELLFTKFFKNAETSITFYSFTPLAPIGYGYGFNAFTLPSSLSYFKKSSQNERIVRVEDLYINVNVGMELVYYAEFTPQELMAIILHEIGHCFDASLFSFLAKISMPIGDMVFGDIRVPDAIYDTVKGLTIRILQTDVLQYGKIIQIMHRAVSSSPFLNKFVIIIDNILFGIRKLRAIESGCKYFTRLLTDPVNLLDRLNPENLFGYSAEKFADSFATSYGYGKETANVMYKISMSKGNVITNKISKVPILNIGYDFANIMYKIAHLWGDVHPDSGIRIQSQLNKLKRDLKDPNLNPKVRKELMENIKDVEDYINNVVLNINEDENKKHLATFCWHYMMIKLFNGKLDPRELFELAWNHEM